MSTESTKDKRILELEQKQKEKEIRDAKQLGPMIFIGRLILIALFLFGLSKCKKDVRDFQPKPHTQVMGF